MKGNVLFFIRHGRSHDGQVRSCKSFGSEELSFIIEQAQNSIEIANGPAKG